MAWELLPSLQKEQLKAVLQGVFAYIQDLAPAPVAFHQNMEEKYKYSIFVVLLPQITQDHKTALYN